MEIHHQLTPVNETCQDCVQYPYRIMFKNKQVQNKDLEGSAMEKMEQNLADWLCDTSELRGTFSSHVESG